MRNNFKLRQLQGFVAAAELGSFALAASRMSMTPPAFSQLIRELESSLGVSLFDRTTRRLDLTAAGEQLLLSVRRPLQDLDHASADMRALVEGKRGRVAFSILHSLAFGIGTRALAALHAKHSNIAVQMIEDQNDVLIDRVLNREVDFGLGMFTQVMDELSFEPLFYDELVAVFRDDHAFGQGESIDWEQLALHPLILLLTMSTVCRLVEASILMTGISREPGHEVVSMITAINIAAAGLGVTVLPRLSLSSLKMEGMTYRAIRNPTPYRQIGIIRRADRPTPEVEKNVLDHIRQEALSTEGCIINCPLT